MSIVARDMDVSVEDLRISRRVIGKGSFGSVRLCEYKEQIYALKVISKHDAEQHGALARVRREVSLHSAVSHENIVECHGTVEDESNVYLLLEHCRHGSLLQLLRDAAAAPDGALAQRLSTFSTVHSIYVQLASALTFLHRRGIVHRDVKLSNILVHSLDLAAPGDAGGGVVVKLCDFGLARKFSPVADTGVLPPAQPSPAAHGLLGDEVTLCGTPGYIPPEALRFPSPHVLLSPPDARAHAHAVDFPFIPSLSHNCASVFKMDAWALGVVIYAVCFGRLPFDARAASCHASALFPLVDIPASLPPALAASAGPVRNRQLISLLQRLLAPDPSDRPFVHEVTSMDSIFSNSFALPAKQQVGAAGYSLLPGALAPCDGGGGEIALVGFSSPSSTNFTNSSSASSSSCCCAADTTVSTRSTQLSFNGDLRTLSQVEARISPSTVADSHCPAGAAFGGLSFETCSPLGHLRFSTRYGKFSSEVAASASSSPPAYRVSFTFVSGPTGRLVVSFRLLKQTVGDVSEMENSGCRSKCWSRTTSSVSSSCSPCCCCSILRVDGYGSYSSSPPEIQQKLRYVAKLLNVLVAEIRPCDSPGSLFKGREVVPLPAAVSDMDAASGLQSPGASSLKISMEVVVATAAGAADASLGPADSVGGAVAAVVLTGSMGRLRLSRAEWQDLCRAAASVKLF